MRRKNSFKTFEEAPKRGPYDEFPMLESGIDPQLCLSRNDRPQPFFLICAQDTLLAQMSGEARIEFRASPVNSFDLVPGDYVYIPGGTPCRIVPRMESVQLRYKPEHPGLEGVAWYGERSGQEISRIVWDTAVELPQEGYLRACNEFNAKPAMRSDPATGESLPPIDLGSYRWAEVAAEVRAALAEEEARLRKKGAAAPGPIPARGATLEIAPPRPGKVPMKVNVYQFGLVAMVPLTAMFPYLDPGSMVPCIAVHTWGGGPAGFYVHENSVDEVNVCFGARNHYQVPGGVRVGPRVHGVGRRPGQGTEDPSGIYLGVITQRQSLSGSQHEAVIFTCEKCNAELFRYEFDAHKPSADLAPLLGDLDLSYVGCPTQVHGSVGMMTYVKNDALRTCKSCGHVNAEFPYRMWGVDRHNPRIAALLQLRKTMTDAAEGRAPAEAGEQPKEWAR